MSVNDCTLEAQSAEHKVRTVFLLDQDKRVALEKLSADTGAPVAELLRRSVSNYLSSREVGGCHG
ncbi:MAG TPA: ribbon-helix-helix domain-containing protein [Candidatus Sulfotelmatobacter sp.]|nr:ribbon-helix-helix domain-containing protein [Candidatus Sulfotelmatobacter sp.]